MLRRREMLALVASGTTTLLSGCFRSEATLRYRLTVEVRTPEGLKAGSSILQNVLYGPSIIPLPGDAAGGGGYKGEAPTVDLGGGRFLFALLCDQYWRRDPLTIVSKVVSYPELNLVRSNDNGTKDRMRKAAQRKAFAEFDRKDYPMLVTFTNVDEPTSVKEVFPDNLSASFGAGYALERITFQAVDPDTALTTGIRQRLTWLGQHPETRLKQQAEGINNPSLARGLFYGCFVAGSAE